MPCLVRPKHLRDLVCSGKLIFVQYEDEDHDKVILASDEDLAAAVEHARSLGWKVQYTNTITNSYRTGLKSLMWSVWLNLDRV